MTNFLEGLGGPKPDTRAVWTAHFGTLLVALSCWACGTGDGRSGPARGPSSGGGQGGSSVGGKSSDDKSGGGGANGGAEGLGTGGSATGGTGGGGESGGTASGGGDNSSVAKACPGQPAPVFAQGATCRNHTDCAGGECRAEYVDTSGVCGACFAISNACLGGVCGDGMACVPAPSDLIHCQCPGQYHCVPGCTSDSCPPGYLCGSNAQCVPGSCETDGYVCPEGEVCNPERSLQANGCTPLSCDGEGYKCPANLICDADASGVDSHGCRQRTCDEGYTCGDARVCDPGATGADSWGCRLSSCEGDGYECAAGHVCDPEAATDSLSHGCRRLLCTEGFECPVNSECSENGTCIRPPCASDSDCECGVCVLGACVEQFYYCVRWPS